MLEAGEGLEPLNATFPQRFVLLWTTTPRRSKSRQANCPAEVKRRIPGDSPASPSLLFYRLSRPGLPCSLVLLFLRDASNRRPVVAAGAFAPLAAPLLRGGLKEDSLVDQTSLSFTILMPHPGVDFRASAATTELRRLLRENRPKPERVEAGFYYHAEDRVHRSLKGLGRHRPRSFRRSH